MYTPKKQSSSVIFKCHNGFRSQHIRPGKQILGKKNQAEFLRSTSLLYKLLPTNLGACKPTCYTFYTWHLRWNSSMRRCFYHTDLGQNAVFHNFAIQIALIQYQDDRSMRALSAKPLKKLPKSPIRPAGSHFWQAPYLQCELWWVFEWKLIELR